MVFGKTLFDLVFKKLTSIDLLHDNVEVLIGLKRLLHPDDVRVRKLLHDLNLFVDEVTFVVGQMLLVYLFNRVYQFTFLFEAFEHFGEFSAANHIS